MFYSFIHMGIILSDSYNLSLATATPERVQVSYINVTNKPT